MQKFEAFSAYVVGKKRLDCIPGEFGTYAGKQVIPVQELRSRG